jgi:hypothetical protein
MPEYRIYTLDFNGHIVGPAKVIECADDDGAVQEALLAAGGHDVELWEGKRLIVRLPRYQKPAK